MNSSLRLRGQFGGESILMKDTLRRILTLRKQEKESYDRIYCRPVA